MSKILRCRPLLILVGILLAALAVSLSWEVRTYYDDGGLGTVAFIILFPLVELGRLVGIDGPIFVVLFSFFLVVLDFFLRRAAAGKANPKENSE